MYLNHKDLSKYLYIDIETDLIPCTRVWLIVVKNIGTREEHVFHGTSLTRFKDFVKAHPNHYWVGHNLVSFDVPTVNRLLDAGIDLSRCIDTLILSKLYDPKMLGGHSLGAWGIRFNYLKGEWNDFSGFSDGMLTYCRRDVDLGILVFTRLSARMAKRGFSEKSCQLEHQVRHIIDKQQQRGWYFDIPRAQALQADLRDKERLYGERVHVLFPPELRLVKTFNYRTKSDGTPYASYLRHLEEYDQVILRGDEYDVYSLREFNIGSPQQRVERLQRAGWVPSKLTKGGAPQADEESILEFARSSGEEAIQAIAEWLVVNGRANMIGTWLNHVNYDDSRMHGWVDSCGARSRRMIHNSPNTANVPSNEALYGEDCRSLWTVPPGTDRCIVGYDAKAVQMRCFAHLLPDVNAGRRYYDTDFCPDPHKENAELAGIPRKPMKNVFYAFIFGAMDPKLGATAEGRDKAFGAFLRKTLYEVTPGLERAIKEAESEFDHNDGFLKCIDGGFVRCPKRQAVLNYKIQPLEAVFMKQASVFIDERARHLDQFKIGDIHDEGQHECARRDAEELGRITSEALRDAGEELGFRVPMAGDYKIGQSWAQTH